LLTRVVPAIAAALTARRADADDPIAHEVPPPPSLTFSVMHFHETAFFGGESTAVVATPRDLAPGARLPMAVLLPGGHHTMQRHDQGCWGWWSEYLLGDCETALRRGEIAHADMKGMGLEKHRRAMNEQLASRAYQGMVIVTPWVVGRSPWPTGNGLQVTSFLRQLVARARAELPVMQTREATGLGGMSTGGLWTLWSGTACADLFGTLVALQPYTEDLVPQIRAQIAARNGVQRIRIMTSDYDHQRETTLALSDRLKTDGVVHELIDSSGPHSAEFAAGPGGLDALLTFDRALRGEKPDGTRPLPRRDDAFAQVAIDDFRADVPAHAPASLEAPHAIGAVGSATPSLLRAHPRASVAATVVAGAAVAAFAGSRISKAIRASAAPRAGDDGDDPEIPIAIERPQR
jgi:hypothetical protein